MKVIGIILIIIALLTVVTAVAFAQESIPTDAEQGNTSPEATQSPGGSDFRLQWYHYIIPAVIIFAMTFFTARSIKPIQR